MLEIQCHQCAMRFGLPDEWAGKQGKCPKCDCVLSIPPLAPPSGPPPQPASAASPPSSKTAPPPLPVPPPAAAQRSGSRTLVMALREKLRPSNIMGLPWPWRIAGAGLVVVAAGLLIFALSRNGPDPGNGVADAGNRRAEVPPNGDGGPDSPATKNGHPPSAAPQRTGPVGSHPSPGTLPPSYAGPSRPDERPLSDPGNGGIVGVSTVYTDRDCRLLQARYGVRIPPAATMIEVDGLRLPVLNPARLAESRSPLLFLPRGEHVVRFRTNEPIRITIRSDLFTEYRKMHRFFDVAGKVRSEALIDRGARAADVHGAPFLLNFAGASHAGANRWDVAERKFRRSLAVNPTFSPAHLNLAECLLRRKLPQQAAREVELADVFNVGNVYGLAAAVAQFRRRLELSLEWGEPIDAEAVSYLSEQTLSEEDLRMVALLEGIGKYAVGDADRGKVLNNLAVHLADVGYPELALHHFRNALQVVKLADPQQRYDLTRTIFANMSDVCRKAGFAEAEEYRRMRLEVKP